MRWKSLLNPTLEIHLYLIYSTAAPLLFAFQLLLPTVPVLVPTFRTHSSSPFQLFADGCAASGVMSCTIIVYILYVTSSCRYFPFCELLILSLSLNPRCPLIPLLVGIQSSEWPINYTLGRLQSNLLITPRLFHKSVFEFNNSIFYFFENKQYICFRSSIRY